MTAAYDYSELPCPMPACASTLHLTWTGGKTLMRGDLDDAPLTASDVDTQTWAVGCADGHVVLVPGPADCGCADLPSADCDCESEDFRTFRPSDLVRLRELLAVAVTR